MRRACPDTPLQFIGVGFRLISWETLDREVMRLVYRCLVRSGISRFIVLEPMHNREAMFAVAKMIREEGGEEIVGALVARADTPFVGVVEESLELELAGAPAAGGFSP